MPNIFDGLIQSIQYQAEKSIGLLTELAGLEEYIAETYAQRCLSELLQNSDDSSSRRVGVYWHQDKLIYANDGRLFTESDFVSLCKSASSTKERGKSIGYRGIGFKSVVNICSSVIISSGDLRCSFNRLLTSALYPGSERVPLVRVPHLLCSGDHDLCNSITKQYPDYTTYFVFRGLNIGAVRQELESITEAHYLFLRNISDVTLDIDAFDKPSKTKISREVVIPGSSSHVSVVNKTISSLSEGSSSTWCIATLASSDIAVHMTDRLPSRLLMENALLHAYLPTQAVSGIGARVNSDFSTDPSRTRLKYDERTDESLKSVSKLIFELLMLYCEDPDSEFWRGFIDAIIPYSNYKILELQGNQFCGKLIAAISSRINELESMSLELRNWPDVYKNIEDIGADFALRNSIFRPVSSTHAEMQRFFESIGLTKVPTVAVIEYYQSRESLIEPRCTPLILRNLLNEGVSAEQLKDLFLFVRADSSLTTPRIAVDQKHELDKSFLVHLGEELMGPSRVRKLLQELDFPSEFIAKHFPTKSNDANLISVSRYTGIRSDPFPENNRASQSSVVFREYLDEEAKRRYGVTDWRLAEELVARYYRSRGYQVIDVSKANKGYDLEATSNSQRICVEVKKLSSPPKDFVMTQNEYNESIILGDSYVMALVCARENGLVEIMLVDNPAKVLQSYTTKRAKSYEFYISGFDFCANITYQ
jgi:hypothetical protein